MEHPESLKDVNDIKITEQIKEFVTGIAQDVQEADGLREEWKRNDREYYRKRYGIRESKTFPWKGCANYVLPLIDANINKAKPSYVNLYAKASPPVNFVPFGAEDIEPALKREKLFDWRMRTKTRFFVPYCIGIDKMLQSGSVVFKMIWNFSTRKYTEFIEIDELGQKVLEALYDPRVTDDMLFQIFAEEYKPDMEFEENAEAIRDAVRRFREGETNIEVSLIEKENDQPEVIPLSLAEIIVPPDTTDIQKARFVDYPYWTTKNDLKIQMRDGKFVKFEDEDIDAWISDTMSTDHERSADRLTKEGVIYESNVSQLILMHETCVWFDVDGDGIDEKCVCNWPDNDSSAVLRFIELPYDHGHWPYAVVHRELTDSGIYSSRGIPAQDLDFQTGISGQFNAMSDNNTIINAPMLEVVEGLVDNPKNIRYVPGQKVITKAKGGFELKQNPNINQMSFIETMSVLKAWSQERGGMMQFSFTDSLNEGGKSGKRSATESAQIGSMHDLQVSLELQVFQDQMQEVYYQLDSLWYQFGNEEEEIAITGEQPMKVKRREIQGRFNIVPNGRIDNTNPIIRLQTAWSLLQAFTGNPLVNQDALIKLYLDYIDSKYSQLLIKPPEQVQQEQARQMQMLEYEKAVAMGDAAKMKELETRLNIAERSAETSLEIQKETILAPITGKKYSAKD